MVVTWTHGKGGDGEKFKRVMSSQLQMKIALMRNFDCPVVASDVCNETVVEIFSNMLSNTLLCEQ